MERSVDEVTIVLPRFAPSMFVSVLEGFGDYNFFGKKSIICMSMRGQRSEKTQWSFIRLSIILLEPQKPLQHGPKTKILHCPSPSELGGQRNTKATLVFFHFLQVFHVLMSLWWLTIALGISLAPWHLPWHVAFLGIGEGFFGRTLTRCGVTLTYSQCVARWWISIFFD